MSVSRDIAQARTYSAAFNVLCVQLLAISIAVGVYSSHWSHGLIVPVAFAVLALHRIPRMIIVIAISVFWALLIQRIFAEAGVGLWSYLFAVVAFAIAYGVNAAGMIGFEHSIPDLR